MIFSQLSHVSLDEIVYNVKHLLKVVHTCLNIFVDYTKCVQLEGENLGVLFSGTIILYFSLRY